MDQPRAAVTLLASVAALACSSSGDGSTIGGSAGANAGGAANPTTNTQTIQVYPGPSELASAAVNIPYTDVTICIPGTSQCQTIHDVDVDTGSVGLRLLASEVQLSLPVVHAGSGTLAECTVFADTSYIWGPVVAADVQLGSEKAASVPIQLGSPTGFPTAPSDCGSPGDVADTIATLGSRGVLGLGVFAEDCGLGCTSAATTVPAIYFNCPSTTASSACTPTTVPVANQVHNPVGLLDADNNGVLISLPTIGERGSATVTGSLNLGNWHTTKQHTRFGCHLHCQRLWIHFHHVQRYYL